MNNLFLFTKHLNEEGCFCLRLDESGLVNAAPEQRTFAEIRNLQKDCSTLIIETSTNASLLTIDLPWLPERKARVAIPFALEDKLAQSLDELHFAFDKIRYQNNQYLVSVIAKQRMHYILQLLAENEIQFTALTLDWFALQPEDSCVSESTLLINTTSFKGSLSEELAATYLKMHPDQQPLLFTDSNLECCSNIPKNSESSYTWIARRILKTNIMNLCQGEIQHGNKSDWIKKAYLLAGAFFCFWLFSLILVNAVNLYFINTNIAVLDEKIAVIYREFFPNAKQVITPKFRIEQLLKSNNSEEQAHFWFLLTQFSKVLDNKQCSLEQLRYQNKTLSVTLVCADFSALEQLENQLKKLQLHVKQTQASTEKQQVVATLELT